MNKDFSKIEDTEIVTDICIIGAGAAGFASALSLLDSGLKVLILEGGLTNPDPRAADIHQGEVISHPHNGIHEARERVVGGTTTKWGGQAYPFLKQDFEKRNYMGLSGWPISYKDLEPYYIKTESILGTDPLVPFQFRPWRESKIKEPDFSADTIDLFVTKWCKIPNFAQQHGHTISKSKNIILLRNANVVELLPTPTIDAVKSLRIRSLCGKKGLVCAKYFIAAGGAIETVRLFLNSKKFNDAGLGNSRGLVGRYFQDHCAAVVGQVIPESRKQFHSLFDPFYKNGFKYFPRIKLDPVYAKKAQILHASAQVSFCEEGDGALGQAKQVINTLRKKQIPPIELLKPLSNPSDFMAVAKAAWRWKVNNRGSSPYHGPIWLEIHSEQEPMYESWIKLSDKKDAFGMPRVSLDWNISELTVNTIKAMAKLVEKEFKSAGIGKVVLEPWIINSSQPLRWITDTFHQAGGLKMGKNEEEGVVDSSCKVFGIENLYVASSAVFPTSSFSNPTMTTIALSIRVCETIKQSMQNRITVNR